MKFYLNLSFFSVVVLSSPNMCDAQSNTANLIARFSLQIQHLRICRFLIKSKAPRLVLQVMIKERIVI